MKLNRTLSLCLTLVICAGLAIGGTLAYYTDTAEVKNTFNLTEGVDITLDEAVVEKNGDNWTSKEERTEEGNTYNGIYPGAHLPKDPTVRLNANSDDAYVRVKVTATNGMNWLGLYADGDNKFTNPGTEEIFHNLTADTLGEGWKLADIAINMPDVVYTLVYNGRLTKDQPATTPAFTEIVFDADITLEDLTTRLGKSFEVNVIAEAIQAASFASATEAFASYDGTAPAAPDTSWYDANATVYTLDSAEDLLGFAQMVNGGNTFVGKTVLLGADIDLQDADWEPIGQTGKTEFKGVFDGQNHVIRNLFIDSEAEVGSHYSSALFGWLEGHGGSTITVKNVKVDGAYVNGHHNTAVIVGYMTGNTLVENCHVTNAQVICTVANSEANGDKAGVIVGNATKDGPSPVKNCSATNCTVSAGRDAGQLVGASSAVKVTDCTATNVTVENNGTGTGANIRNEIIGRIL